MLLKKMKKIFKCVMVLVLVMSTLNFAYAEDALDMSHIVFNVKGNLVEENETSYRIHIAIDIENTDSEDFLCDSIKSPLSNGVEYIEDDSSLSHLQDNQVVLLDQLINANSIHSCSYDIKLLKEEIFEGMSWFINDKEIKKIDSIEEILGQDDIEKLNDKKVSSKKISTRQNRRSNDGVFNGGVATLGIDGTKITVTAGYFSEVPDNSKLVVEKVDLDLPFKVAHQQLKNGFGYKVSITNPQGELINGIYGYSINIENENGLGITDNAKVITKDPSQELSVNAQATINENSISISSLPLDGKSGYIYVGELENVTDTFESEGGKYNLGYIFENYNAFIGGNYTGQHVVGSLIVGGTTTSSAGIGGITTNAPDFYNTAPSYFKGGLNVNNVIVRYPAGKELYTYFGTQIGTVGVSNQANNDLNAPYAYTDSYVDFDKAFKQMSDQVSALNETTQKTIVDMKNTAATLETDGYQVEGNTVYLCLGTNYSFDEMDGINIVFKAPINATEEEKANPLMIECDTLIFSNAKKVDLKSVIVEGANIGGIETGLKAGIAFITPEAETFNAYEMLGHTYAPNAVVDYSGGNYNGCVITKKNFKTTAEGHMFPYSGKELLPATTSLKFGKTVDSLADNVKELFEFNLQECDENGIVLQQAPVYSIYNTDTTQVDGKITSVMTFDFPFEYRQAGTFYYKLTEINKNDGVYQYDDSIYYVEVKTEEIVEGSTTSINVESVKYFTLDQDKNKAYLGNNSYPIFNNITPEKERINIEVVKTWVDNDNQDGLRPKSIVVHLLADGIVVASQTLTAENGWKYTFNDLDKYKDDNEIKYTITEDNVEGYDTSITGYSVTNTHIPETTNISGIKTWNDANNQDGLRPESIKVNLLADGVLKESKTVTKETDWKYTFNDLDKYKAGKEIVYTVNEDKVEGYTTEVLGYNITNTHIPGKTSISVSKVWNDNNNQDGLRSKEVKVQLMANGKDFGEQIVLKDANNWSYTWNELPEKVNGEIITYDVKEVGAVLGYATTYSHNGNEFKITNTHAPETIDISGSKTWNDNNNQDGLRPTSIKVNLVVNGKVIQSQTVTEQNEWKYTFENLDKFEKGIEIQYTVQEEVVEGYSTEIKGYDITNSYTPGQTSRTVTKIWDDNNNQDGIRPTEIRVQLMADGKETGEEVILNEVNSWTYTWDELPEKAAGKTIDYQVKEVGEVKGYTTSYSEDTFIITNSHAPEKTKVDVEKEWKDLGEGYRPESITVRLYADGEEIKTIQMTKENGWKYTFENLDKYKDGKEILYTVSEDQVEGYKTEVSGYKIINSQVLGSLTIKKVTNGTTTPDNTVFTVTNEAGEVVKAIKYSEMKTTGSYTVKDLPLGKYTVSESGSEVKNYKLEVTGNNQTVDITEGLEYTVTITNTYTKTEKGAELVIYKITEDALRDGTIVPLPGANFVLYKDGDREHPIEYTSLEENGTKFVFKGLENGVYTIHESEVPEGYEGADDFDIEVKDGVITCPEFGLMEHQESFYIVNSDDDGLRPGVLGDKVKFEDDDNLEFDVIGDKVKTSDDQELVGYSGLGLISLAVLYLLKKKKIAK